MNHLLLPDRRRVLSALVAVHRTITVRTERPVQFVDVTDAVADHVQGAGLLLGVVNVQVLHTTAGIVLNEHEPLLLADVERTLERLAPSHLRYEHDDLARRRPAPPPDEPRNGHAHCQAMLLRASETVNVVAGRLQLGPWQRLLLVELDGPRTRSLSIAALGAGGRA